MAPMSVRELIQPDSGWLDAPTSRRVVWLAWVACAGLAIYGFTGGYWRDPLLGCYVAVKMPLLVALTLVCNGLLNGLLAVLLGTGLSFRQSLMALLSAFALAGVILGSLAPATLLLGWNAPPPGSRGENNAHDAYLVTHTLLIGFAGIAANIHLHRLLVEKSPTRAAATATLLAWLGGNGFLGAQFSWILRPFFGTPGLKVQFLRDHPLQDGNFYQAVWRAINHISGDFAVPVMVAVLVLLAIPIIRAIQTNHQTTLKP